MASKNNSQNDVETSESPTSNEPNTPTTLSTEASGTDPSVPLPADDNESSENGIPLERQLSKDEVESVVGVSIGRAQSHYKSSQTPAKEKSQILAESGGLDDEDGELRDVHQMVTEPPQTSSDDIEQSKDHAGPSARRPAADVTAKQQVHRGGTTRSILHDATAPTRQRSISGPMAVADGLKRLLNEMQSLSLPRSPTLPSFSFGQKSTDAGQHSRRTSTMLPRMNTSLVPAPLRKASQPTSPDDLGAAVMYPIGEQHSSTLQRRRTPAESWLDGPKTPTAASPDHGNTQSLRRVNSDQSLYLQRTLSRTSTIEDVAKWEHVQEQVNSRLKALTDSLQDSKIRMPKMPTVDMSALKPSFLNRTDTEHTGSSAHIQGESKADRTTNAPLPRRSTLQVIPSPKALTSEELDRERFPNLSRALTDLTGDVLVLGGYRGSILRSAKPPHHQLWIPIKVGLNLRKVDLEVGLTREDEERMEETIIPSGVLSHIGPVDICRRLLKKLQKCHNSSTGTLRVHDYGYDWRLSPDLLVDQLIRYLETLQCNKAKTTKERRGATIIAHSLGGLLVRSAINRRPDLFAGVVYAGVPQHCVNILGPLRNGDDVLFSSRVLTAQVNFTLRTSFALMPESGICFFNKKTKERYDLDFFDPKTWEEYRLTPCLGAPLPPYGQRKGLMDSMSESLTSFPRRASAAVIGDSTPKKNANAPMMDVKNTFEEPVKQMENSTMQPTMQSSSSADPQLSVSTRVTIPRKEAFDYLARTLASILAFKRSHAFNSDYQAANLYPPAAVIYGKSVPTVYGARVASKEAIKHSDAYDDLAFSAGDGVVLAKAAMLPPGYKIVKDGLVQTDRGHVGLLGDLEAVGRCLNAVIEGRKKGIGLGTSENVQ